MFLAASALGLTSAGTGYYIYKNHPDHFKETIFNKSVEAYTAIKTTSQSAYNSLYRTVTRGQDPNAIYFGINDLKIIQPDLILDLPATAYPDLNWSSYHPSTMIHVCYSYQDQQYRIVFNYQQDLSILTTNTGWIKEGFHNGIDVINSNIPNQEKLWELVHQYGGPLGDFYEEAKHLQNAKGFLNEEMTARLITHPDQQFIKMTNILGETRRFPPKPQEETNQEETNQEETNQEETNQEETNQEETNQEETNQEETNQETNENLTVTAEEKTINGIVRSNQSGYNNGFF